MNRRSSAQLATALITFFRHASLQQVPDPRRARGKRYTNTCLLQTMITSLVCGCTGLQAAERLSHTLSPAARRLLAIPRNISDTALRYWLLKVDPGALRGLLRHVAQHMHATGRIRHDAFSYPAIALDAKETFTSIHDPTLTQRRQQKSSLRTLTVCLISSALNPCLDTIPLSPAQNERSAFPEVFQGICKHYGDLFQLITYDAGVCSQSNATLVHEAKRGYVWALKSNQATLFEEAKRLLRGRSSGSCQAQETDCIGGKVVTRRVWLHTVSDDTLWWSHIQTVIRVQTYTQDKKTQAVTEGNRYFISNIPTAIPHQNKPVCKRNKHVLHEGLTPSQWLQVVRLHWGVENHCHCLWDKQMHEDRKRWFFEPKGMLNVQLLRRIASLFLVVYRHMRCKNRQAPLSFPHLMELFLHMVWGLTRIPKRALHHEQIDSS